MPVRTATASQQANMHSRSTAGREQCAMQHMAFNKSANWVQPHQPASFAILIERKARRTYPYFPNIRVQHPCALSDYNNGATLTRTGEVHTHLFFLEASKQVFLKIICAFQSPASHARCAVCKEHFSPDAEPPASISKIPKNHHAAGIQVCDARPL
jgi:hypothetical protein